MRGSAEPEGKKEREGGRERQKRDEREMKERKVAGRAIKEKGREKWILITDRENVSGC